MMAARSCASVAPQSAISPIVRPHPVHSAPSIVSVQTSMQGDSTVIAASGGDGKDRVALIFLGVGIVERARLKMLIGQRYIS